jgi:molybdate-binding protein/DNA-binding XRE family transcriptional regulator
MESKGAVLSRVAAIRQGRGVSAAELAKRVGVSRQTIYAIEAGSYVPNTAVALRLARELKVSVEELFRLGEERAAEREAVEAVVLARGGAKAGRPMTLARVREQWVAAPAESVPYFLAEADGLVRRTRTSRTTVELVEPAAELAERVVIAGCDPGIGLLARMAERLAGVQVVTAPASSRQALEWMKAGLVHIAGSHLEDPETGEFNVPWVRRLMPREDVVVVTFARWEEGLVVARGNPLGIRDVSDLVRPKVRLINREPGSGSRALLERLLKAAGVGLKKVSGFEQLAGGHLEAAQSVARGAADCCVATSAAARAFDLSFIPIRGERFDFVVRRELVDTPAVRGVLEALQRAALRRKLEALAGYDTAETGRVVDVR